MLVCKIWWVNCHKQQQKDEETDQNLKKIKKNRGVEFSHPRSWDVTQRSHNNVAWHQKEED